MKVVLVSKALVVASYRGKLRAIARLGVDLTAVVPRCWHEGESLMKIEPGDDENYRIVETSLRWNGHFHLHYYPGLSGVLEEVRPDIVHVDEEPYNFATFHAVRAASRIGARTLFFTWQNIYRRYPPPFSHFERSVFRTCPRAIAGNAAAETIMRRKGYTGATSVIPQFGVDPEQFAPAPPTFGGAPVHRPFTVGYFGRLVAAKGVDDLIAAFAGLSNMPRLLVVGDGPDRERLRRTADCTGAGHRVEWRSRTPSKLVPDLMRSCDALVLPSRTTRSWKEQFGRVLVEAMACGVPVIGSDSGEIPQVIGDAGLIFPERDVKGLRDALAMLQTSEQLRSDLSRSGRERVLAGFTHERIAEQTLEVYERLLPEARP